MEGHLTYLYQIQPVRQTHISFSTAYKIACTPCCQVLRHVAYITMKIDITANDRSTHDYHLHKDGALLKTIQYLLVYWKAPNILLSSKVA